MEKLKIILDMDPGVDDAMCFAFAATDPQIDIKLITIEDGNIPLAQTIKNTMFLQKKLNTNIDVISGPSLSKRTDKEAKAAQKRAEEMHGKASLGGINVPDDNYPKPLNKDVADAMYELLKKYPKQITIVGCAPLTNIRYLFDKYKDATKLVKQIVFMGGSFGLPGQPAHISYNAGANPFAYEKVVHSGVPCTIVPSAIGRTKARFTKPQVDKIAHLSPFGRFLAQMFETYWEKGFEEKFVANNDICTYLYLSYPDMFKTQTFDIMVDLIERPGALSKTLNPKSNISIITDLDRRQFIPLMMKKIKEFNSFDF